MRLPSIRRPIIGITFSLTALLITTTFQNCGQTFKSIQPPKAVELYSTVSPDEIPLPKCAANEVFSNGRCVNNRIESLSQIDPVKVLPHPSVLSPKGQFYEDNVPATLDLAERAQYFLQGSINTLRRDTLEPPMYVELFGDAHIVGTPGKYNDGGNWGKTGHAMIVARMMSGYDLDDRHGTLTAQLYSIRNMFDPKKGLIPSDPLAVEALMYLYKWYPSNELQETIEILLTAVRARLNTYKQTQQNMEMVSFTDVSYYTLPWIMQNFESQPTNILSSEKYFSANLDNLWASGKLARSMSTWNMITDEQTALDTAIQLGNQIRFINGGVYWNTALPVGSPAGYGHFTGHAHTHVQALTGLTWLSEAILRKDPKNSYALEMLSFVNAAYLYEKELFGLGVLGNFSEICELSSMIRLALKLSELGIGDYYEDVDRWTRNSLAEAQILDNSMISSRPSGDDFYNNIGQRVWGLFFEDNAHPFAISTDASAMNFFLVACGLGNAMISMYEVWDHIVQFKGQIAQINMPLNRRSTYLDIKSELPYSGIVRIQTKGSIGPISSIKFRVPDWTRKDSVNVKVNGQDYQWTWLDGSNIQIPNIHPNTEYVVYIPMITHNMTITQMQSQDVRWNEWNIPAFMLGPTYIKYTGKFRGNTLVDVDSRPSGGKPRYQRNEFAMMGDNVDVAATYVRKTVFSPEDPDLEEVYFAPVNGSQQVDIIKRNLSPGDLTVQSNNGSSLTTTYGLGQLAAKDWEIRFADIDGDKKADLIGHNVVSGDLRVWPSTGSGLGTPFAFGNMPKNYDFQFADITGDGKADLLGRNLDTGDINVWSSNGTSNFAGYFAFGNLPRVWEVQSADITGNGKADLVGRNLLTGEVKVWGSDGHSHFIAFFDFGNLPSYYEMYLADMNGDKKVDLVARHKKTGDISVWLSSGGAGHLASYKFGQLTDDYEITFADINGDGKSDLIGRKNGKINVWFSNGVSGWSSTIELK